MWLWAKRLAQTASAPDSVSADDAGRLMGILSEISNGGRLLPSLMRLQQLRAWAMKGAQPDSGRDPLEAARPDQPQARGRPA